MSILSKGNFRQLFSAKACTTTICVSAQMSLLKKTPPFFLAESIGKIICHRKFWKVNLFMLNIHSKFESTLDLFRHCFPVGRLADDTFIVFKRIKDGKRGQTILFVSVCLFSHHHTHRHLLILLKPANLFPCRMAIPMIWGKCISYSNGVRKLPADEFTHRK